MPSRWLCGLIVLFWLTTMGWLFWHDLWPSWRPGEPPPYHIDDLEEVRKKDNSLETNWIVRCDKEGEVKKLFRAYTWVEYQEDDDNYTINSHLFHPVEPAFSNYFVAKQFQIERINSAYRVQRDGRLHELHAEVEAKFHEKPLEGEAAKLIRKLSRMLHVEQPKDSSSGLVSLLLQGRVRDGQLFAHCRIFLGQLSETGTAGRITDWDEALGKVGKPALREVWRFDLPPAAVSYTGSVLMPLHPVNQISGLRPGQYWRQPLVDPLRDAFAAVPGFAGGARTLQARVLPQAEMLTRSDGETSDCLVIEYTNDENETVGRTWVEQSSNRVLQQETIVEGERWIMTRELQRGIATSIHLDDRTRSMKSSSRIEK